MRLILTGQRFGRLLVIARAPNIGRWTAWDCICDCGNRKIIKTTSLTNHLTQSCGCYRKEKVLAAATTHGMSGTPEHYTWALMLNRCRSPKNPRYEDYGGRGITVCERWTKSFAAFYEDMGPRPPKHTLDRINTSGNYEPGNCRWATWAEQAKTRRKRGTGCLARRAKLSHELLSLRKGELPLTGGSHAQ